MNIDSHESPKPPASTTSWQSSSFSGPRRFTLMCNGNGYTPGSYIITRRCATKAQYVSESIHFIIAIARGVNKKTKTKMFAANRERRHYRNECRLSAPSDAHSCCVFANVGHFVHQRRTPHIHHSHAAQAGHAQRWAIQILWNNNSANWSPLCTTKRNSTFKMSERTKSEKESHKKYVKT